MVDAVVDAMVGAIVDAMVEDPRQAEKKSAKMFYCCALC